jgi:Xaa-Pro dipeptidase
MEPGGQPEMMKSIGAFEVVPAEDLQKRVEGLKRLMAEAGTDFAVIVENVDKFYFTGTMQPGMLVIPTEKDPLLFVQKGTERARAETTLAITPVKSDKEIGDILTSAGISKGTAGFELDVVSVSFFERLRRLIHFDRHTDITPAIKELRAVKSPFELEQIRKSGAMISRVFAMAKEVIREGVSEIDIDAALVAEGRRSGHQGYLRMRGFNQEMTTIMVQSGYTGTVPTFVDGPITGAGVTPAVPNGASFKKVEKGIPVTVDYGGGYNGYTTDETRVFVVGELQERFKKPYETARTVIEEAAACAKEGVDCTEIFSRAHEVVKKAGLLDYFMGYGEGQVQFIGHGLGLEINELPIITARHSRILKAGMVFAFEPKFVLPPYGAIGIEVDFIVRRGCLERVTDDSLDIVSV